MNITAGGPDRPDDYRGKVALQRRQKTRMKLLECALHVLHEKGPEVVIEDFIAAAEVSRGTFYNHFKTLDDLVVALASTMNDELVAMVNDYLVTCQNPLERLSAGVRLHMKMAQRFPIWGTFLLRVGVRVAVRDQPIEKYVMRDLTEARHAGLIDIDDVLVARDLVIGSIFYGIGTMATTSTTCDEHPQHLVELILRGLRVPEELIAKLAHSPLPSLGPGRGQLFSKLQPIDDDDKPQVVTQDINVHQAS